MSLYIFLIDASTFLICLVFIGDFIVPISFCICSSRESRCFCYAIAMKFNEGKIMTIRFQNNIISLSKKIIINMPSFIIKHHPPHHHHPLPYHHHYPSSSTITPPSPPIIIHYHTTITHHLRHLHWYDTTTGKKVDKFPIDSWVTCLQSVPFFFPLHITT